jgi:ligand-binding SRPBCC domain-containing protein
MYQYKTQQWLPVTIKQAWDFFSSPKNLSRITPPELDFKVLTPNLDNTIYNGMLIDYSVKPIFGISMNWTTEIINVSKQEYFTDKQLKGPYRIWKHTHYFEEENGGIMMTDEVNYQLPFGIIGSLLHRLLIRSKIESIFEYRRTTLTKIFIA